MHFKRSYLTARSRIDQPELLKFRRNARAPRTDNPYGWTPTPPTLRDLALCLRTLALEAHAKLPYTPPSLARAIRKATQAASADLLTATVAHLAGRTPDADALASAAVRLRVARVYLDSITPTLTPPPQAVCPLGNG